MKKLLASPTKRRKEIESLVKAIPRAYTSYDFAVEVNPTRN
jgi:hypothetical protein